MTEDKKFEALEVLKKMNVATANQVAKDIKVHYFTAERMLDKLVDEGTITVQRNLVGKYVKKYYFLVEQTSKVKKGKVDKNEGTKIK